MKILRLITIPRTSTIVKYGKAILRDHPPFASTCSPKVL